MLTLSLFAPEFCTRPGSLAKVGLTTFWRDVDLKSFMISLKVSQYHSLFFSVIPNRMKNTTAKSGEIHWLNLMFTIVDHPADFHSSEVTFVTADIFACMTFHLGQKVVIPPCWKSAVIRFSVVMGSVMKISNEPSTMSFKTHCLRMGKTFSRNSSSFLC